MCEYCEPMNETGECKDIIYEEGWTDHFHLCKFPAGTYRIECYADSSSPINFCPMCGRKL